ncbi:MAG: PAS domain S-box protein [Phycisphaerales bacterium]|nr:MAG: PAS domain S-box protein [Phycisphaerales bacterium]
MTTNADATEFTLKDVLRHAVDGMFVIDRNRQVVMFSQGCERITGTDCGSVTGTSCACFQLTDCRDEHGRPLSGALCPSQGVFAGDVSSARQRMSILHRDGRRVWIENTYSPMYDDNGQVACVVGIMRDITDAREKADEFQGAADPGMAGVLREASASPGVFDSTQPADTYTSPEQGTDNMGPLDRILTTIERREILAALKRANGQRTLAARLLGISRSRLYRRMEALGIDPRELGGAREVHPREDA